MKKQNNIIVTIILSIVSASLTLFAPFVTETTMGLLRSYKHNISLFSDVVPGFCAALTVISSICLILFSFMLLTQQLYRKGIVGVRISGCFLLVMQIICTVTTLNYYDTWSFFGALHSDFSDMKVHSLAVVMMIITVITIINTWNLDD